jgi:PKHD-type hydroxylase
MDKSNILPECNNLVNYYYFKNVFNNAEIEKLKELAMNYPIVQGTVNGNIDTSYRLSEIRWLQYNNDTEYLYKQCKNLLTNANKKMWNFHVTNIKEPLQFGEYKSNPDGENGKYDWHMDIGKGGISTRKLSMSIQLSDSSEYEGGDLEFMIHRNIIKAPRDKGTVIFFPSYLTHRITPVTSGKRQSLVTWFHGPPFV